MILISPSQLKIANQIFNEHKALKSEAELLQLQADRYEELYKDELRIDSTYEATLDQLEESLNTYKYNLSKAEQKLKKTELNCWRGSSILLILLLICVL